MKRLLIGIIILAFGAWVWADISITQGTGTTIGTDAVGGVNYQKVKLCDGAAGTTTCFSTAPVNMIAAIPAGTNAIGSVNNVAGFTVTAGTGTWTVLNAGGFTVAAGTGSWQVANSTIGMVGTLSNNGVAAGTNRLPTLPGISQSAFGNNGSQFTQGRDVATMILSSSGLMGVWSGPDITFASYSASTNTFSLVAASTNTDVTALCGNAAKTVYLRGLRVSCTQTTAGNVSLSVMKRSSAYTGQWSTMTATPEDSNYGVVQSSAIFFTTGNQNNGTLVGHLDNYQLGCMAAATATPNDIYISPANWRLKPIVLRGATQCVGVNFENTSMTGAKISVNWQWMEVVSP